MGLGYRMEERIQGAQQAAQHFPPDSLLCDAFKSAKNDGLDEIIIIASLNSQLNLRSKDACPAMAFWRRILQEFSILHWSSISGPIS